MRRIPAGACLFWALLLVPVVTAGAVSIESPPPVDVPAILKQVGETFSIELIVAPTFPVKTAHGAITGKVAAAQALERYVVLFQPEWRLYPPSLIQHVRLKRIVFCAELAFAGQLRAAVPNFEQDTYYLDVSRGAASKSYQRRVIHHDFFHIIDQRDGHLYHDERWAALNPAGFKYGTGGRNAQAEKGTGVLTDRYPGFLNHYSTTGVEEDKAEVFTHLIVDGPYVEGRVKTDRVLAAKVARMKELLTAFCPEMNEKFWNRVAKLKRAD